MEADGSVKRIFIFQNKKFAKTIYHYMIFLRCGIVDGLIWSSGLSVGLYQSFAEKNKSNRQYDKSYDKPQCF